MKNLPGISAAGALGAVVFGVTAFAQSEPVPAYSNHRPVWSPDGESIVFMSTRDGDENEWELYLMRLDGTEIRRLTHHAGWDGYAAFDPTGMYIAFDREDDEGKRICALDLSSGAERVLVGNDPGMVGGARFSPDGSRIIFASEREGNREIYTIKSDGSDLKRLTSTDENEAGGCFSPDGESILFVTWHDGHSTIEIMNADASSRRRLLDIGGRAYGLDWSPDGSQIVFNTDDNEDDAEIYVMHADGSDLRRLTDNDDWDHLPLWSPDGTKIIFTSYRSGVEEIYMMRPDGDEVTRISTESSGPAQD